MLPEMFSTGFTMASREVAETMDGETVRWLQDTARRLGKAVCGSVVIESGGAYFNRLLWATPDEPIVTYDKRHRFRMAGEHEHYDSGDRRVVVTLKGWRVNLMVCYDLRFPVFFRNRGDYDALVCVANWPAARRDAWQALLRARAIENQAYVAGVNVVGTDGNNVVYAGGSAVYAPDGDPVFEIGDATGVFSATFDAAILAERRAAFPVWLDADEFEVRV